VIFLGPGGFDSRSRSGQNVNIRMIRPAFGVVTLPCGIALSGEHYMGVGV
jgi:hypothetical protein